MAYGSPDSGRLCSVVIPVYNREYTIGDAVDSVIKQDPGFVFEIVVVDDGSEDGTAEVVSGLREDVKLIQKANGGPGSARNTGVKAARGEIIAFLDSDDLMVPGRLGVQIEYMLANPDVAVSFGEKVVEDGGCDARLGLRRMEAKPAWSICEDAYSRLLTEEDIICNSASAVRRSVYMDVGMQSTDKEMAEDYDMWLRIARAGGKVAKCASPFIVKRRFGDNLTASTWMYRGPCKALARHLEEGTDLPEAVERSARQRLTALCDMLFGHDLADFGRERLREDLKRYKAHVPKILYYKWRLLAVSSPRAVRLIRKVVRKSRAIQRAS